MPDSTAGRSPHRDYRVVTKAISSRYDGFHAPSRSKSRTQASGCSTSTARRNQVQCLRFRYASRRGGIAEKQAASENVIMQNVIDQMPDRGRLTKQIEFIIEMDRLKHVVRQSLVADGSRRENTARHARKA
jgi:hypothetical protein